MFYELFYKVKANRNIKGIQIYDTWLELKNGLIDFKEIWYQVYIKLYI